MYCVIQASAPSVYRRYDIHTVYGECTCDKMADLMVSSNFLTTKRLFNFAAHVTLKSLVAISCLPRNCARCENRLADRQTDRQTHRHTDTQTKYMRAEG